MGSRGFKYAVVFSTLYYSYMGVYTSPDKVIPALCYTMKVSKYSATCIIDHQY